MRGALAALLLSPAFAACLAPAPPEALARGGFGSEAVVSGEYVLGGDFSRVLTRGAHRILPDEVTHLASPVDGAAIQIAVARPDVPPGTRVPVVAWITPYLRDLAAAPIVEQDGSGGLPDAPGIRGAFLVENLVPHGYAVAAVAVRGSAGSGGCLETFGPSERADVLAAVDWLVAEPWATGRLGTFGLSYEAGTQWALAASGHPALRTIVAAAGPNDLWTAVFRNGSANYGPATVPTSLIAAGATFRDPTAAPQTACPALVGYAGSAASATLGDRAAPGGEEFARRAFREGVERNYRGSVLLVHGFRDEQIYPRNSFPWVQTLADRGVPVKQILGPWGHEIVDAPAVAARRADFAELLLRWYDYHLRDAPSGLGPPVEVADSEGRWRSERAWPPADAREERFYLRADGGLGAPSERTEEQTLGPDPRTAVLDLRPLRCLESACAPPLPCAACLTFATEPFDRAFRFAGLPRVHLTVTPSGPGGYVTAKLYAATAETVTLLSAGQMDLRHAEGEARSVEPGVPMVAPLELEPTDAVVPAGSRLLLVVSQGGYGSPGASGAFFYHHASGPPFPMRVSVGGEASVVRLLAFERDEEDARFFEPPGGS